MRTTVCFRNPQPDLEELILGRAGWEQVPPAFILHVARLWSPGCRLPSFQTPPSYEVLGITERSPLLKADGWTSPVAPSGHQTPPTNTLSEPHGTQLRHNSYLDPFPVIKCLLSAVTVFLSPSTSFHQEPENCSVFLKRIHQVRYF